MNKSVNNLMCFLILFLFLISSPFPAYADTPAEIGQDPPATDEAIPDAHLVSKKGLYYYLP